MFEDSSLQFDENDDFYQPSTSTTLSKIFNISMDASSERENATLQYVPPKQKSDAKTNSNGEKTEWQTIIAKVVFAYKLINQENIPQGKIGLAMLRNIDNQFKLILYKTKHIILSTTTLTSDTKMYLKQQYLQYPDNDSIFWSLIFDGNERDLFLHELEKICPIHNETKDKVPADSGNASTKSNILSRLAKVGQPLPQMVVSTSEISDSSDTEGHRINYSRARPVSKVSAAKNVCQDLVPENTNRVITQFASANILVDPSLNMFFSENRTQNTELRMNLSKLETKIEKVLDKIDMIAIQTKLSDSKKTDDDRDDEILELETKLLEMKKENRQLKLKIQELSNQKSNQNKEDNYKIENEKYRKEIDKLKTKETENAQEINEQNDISNKLKITLNERENDIEILKKDLNNLSDQLLTVKATANSEMNAIKSTADLKIIELENVIKNLNQTNLESSQEIAKLQMELSADNNNHSTVDSLVKNVMNNLYQKMQQEFGQKSTYTQEEVLMLSGKLIKSETMAILKKC